MKLVILLFLFFIHFSKSQELKVSHITEIAKHEFAELDHVMVSKLGFERIKDVEDINQKVYSSDSNDAEKLVVITVIKHPKNCSNVLSIVNRSADSVAKLKEELPTQGYRYIGKKKMSKEILVSQFRKENMMVSVTDHVTAIGAYQILLTCR